MDVHPLRSCFNVRISSKVETVLGSVLIDEICRFRPISSSNSIIMLQPLIPHASSSLIVNMSTPIRCRSSHGSKTSVQASKWRCLASRRVFVSISATSWIASSLKVGSWKSSSSSSWWGFVLLGGVSVAGVQLEPVKRKIEEIFLVNGYIVKGFGVSYIRVIRIL